MPLAKTTSLAIAFWLMGANLAFGAPNTNFPSGETIRPWSPVLPFGRIMSTSKVIVLAFMTETLQATESALAEPYGSMLPT